jgi:hypothetical protein
MATKNNDRVRYRYGICLNDNCEKCKSKEIQEIPARKDFVCQNPECGKPLRECPPPKTGGNKKLIGIIAGVVALLAIVGGIIVFGGSGKEAPKQEPVAVAPVDSDSIKAAQMAAENQKLKDSLAAAEAAKQKAEEDAKQKVEEDKQEEGKVKEPVKPQNGYVTNYNIGYGTYTGDIKNGKPHGHGTITYRSSHAITGGIQASPGDKYEGDFRDGRVSGGIGYWTHNGNMQTINP